MKHILFASIIPLCLFSCQQKEQDKPIFGETIYTPSVSSGFEIKTAVASENTLISVKDPWQGADSVTKDFLIIRNDTVPDGYKGQYIIGSPRRIVCMSSTHIAMLDALGATDRIVGVSGFPYITNSYIRNNEDKIPDVGYEGNMDYETLLAAKPDLVLLFSVNGASTLEPKLEEFGIPYLYIGDYVEEDPLGKAEWIIPLAEVIGERETGINIYKGIAERYKAMKEKAAGANTNKPKVMLNAPFGESWFMPPAKSYVARMIEDAGGDYIYKKDTGTTSMPIDMEEAFILLQQADFWLNPGTFKSLPELKSSLPKFKDVKIINSGNIYNNNLITSPGGGNDCYESGVVNPDLILRDIIKILHPSLIEEDFVYYHNLQ